MRRIAQLIALVALCSSATAQTTVKGEYIAAKGKPTPKFAYLFTSGKSKGMQAKIENGKFGFELPAQEKNKLTYGFIYFSSKVPFGMPERIKEKRHDFVIEEGAVSVTYNNSKSYFVAKGRILNEQKNMLNAIDSIRFSEYERMKSSADLHAINTKGCAAVLALLKKYPTSPIFRQHLIICIMFYPVEDSSYNELSTVYNSLADDFKTSPQGRTALRELEKLKQKIEAKQLDEKMEVAKFTLTGQDMATVNLFPNSNKVLLLDFWTTWCSPCRKDQPILEELHKRFHEKGFSVIGIAMDRKVSEWSSYIKTKQHSYPQFWNDPVKTASHPFLGKVHKYPTYILVDAKKMKVIRYDLGIDQVEKEINQLLK